MKGLEGSRRVQEGLGGLEGPGGSGRVWEGPGGSGRIWEDLGGSGRVQEGLGGLEGLGGSGRVWEGPGGSGWTEGLEGSRSNIIIEVKFETEKLALVMILPDIWGIGFRGRCL